MTVQSAASRNSYTASGGVTFPYTFLCLASTDLSVYDEGALVSTSAYTVTGTGTAAGGNVVFGSAPTTGHTIIILSSAAYTQGLDLVANDPLPADSLETALDRTTILAKQLLEKVGRAPQFDAFGCTAGVMIDLPTPGYFLMWNPAGTRIVNGQQVTVGTLTVPAFTAGSVVFTTDATTLGQDNAELFWDATSKFLGIGTATPTAQLHVDGIPGVGDEAVFILANGGGTALLVQNNSTDAAAFGVNILAASTATPPAAASPALKVESTGYYAGLFQNVTDRGTSAADNASMIALVANGLHANAGYFEQGPVTLTLTEDNPYATLYATRTAQLGGKDFTGPILRLDDVTAATGPILDARRNGTEMLSLTNAGSLQSCELRVHTAPAAPVTRAVYDQSLAKAWVVFDGGNTNPITPAVSFNIKDARVTKTKAGQYCVSFITPFACNRYAVVATAAPLSGTPRTIVPRHDEMNTGCVKFESITAAGSLEDEAYISVVFYGPQA